MRHVVVMVHHHVVVTVMHRPSSRRGGRDKYRGGDERRTDQSLQGFSPARWMAPDDRTRAAGLTLALCLATRAAV